MAALARQAGRGRHRIQARGGWRRHGGFRQTMVRLAAAYDQAGKPDEALAECDKVPQRCRI